MNLTMDWRIAPALREQTAALADELELPRPVAHLLASRGFTEPETARRFLNPDIGNLVDPFTLIGMDKAVARLQQAREKQEKVLVFGDYDVDGICGTAILLLALRRFGLEHVSAAIPHRQQDGYGINPERIAWAREQGYDLIVTADNGATALDAAEAAREIGLDLIVTDHHQLEDELPAAVAVINPKRHEPDYPGFEACGAAVALKLAWALTGELEDLDLAAMGTVADIMPLLGENRDIVAAGLAFAAQRKRPGLVALAKEAGTPFDDLRASHIAFQLGPRINAAGRLGDAELGLRLLTTEDQDEARELARELDTANQDRRAIEKEIFDEALHMLAHGFEEAVPREAPAGPGEQTELSFEPAVTRVPCFHPDQRAVVLASEAWHPGVVGVVASRLQSRYYRPVVLIALGEDGTGKGSARSIDGLDIHGAIARCAPHLSGFGGHEGAAGVSLSASDVGAFREAFEAACAKALPPGDIRRPLTIDAQAGFSEVDSRLVRSLERLEPFGHGNPAPVFCTFGARPLPGSWRLLRNNHMTVTLNDSGRNMRAIGFRMGERAAALDGAERVDVAYSPQFNTFRGETTVQLVLKDIRLADA